MDGVSGTKETGIEVKEESKEETVEIIESAETGEVKEETFSEEGLTDGEVELAKEHGLTKDVKEEDGEHKEQPESKTEDSEEDEGEEKEVKQTFEEVEKDEKKLKKFNPNEQALYWKYKADKKKRQKAQKDYEEIKAEYELSRVKDSSYSKKLERIKDALKGDEVTIEALQSIIGAQAEVEADDTPLTKGEFKKMQSEDAKSQKEISEANKEQAERIQTAEEIGKTKYENFEDITTWTQEVVDADKTGTYKSVLDAAFSDTEISEEELIERIVTIAKLNPAFGKEKSEAEEAPEKKKETKVDRVIKNSKKKVSSAAVGGGGGKRVVSHADMTSEDAESLTTTQWNKLPDEVRTRLLREAQ